ATAKRLAKDLDDLRKAPLAEPYAGPAILRPRAAGVFFHEIFGHRIEGHRQKDEDEGRTFAKKVGQAVMPAFITVIDDPTRAKHAGKELNGAYKFDDEGVESQKVVLVDKGVLKTFLMGRSPVRNVPKSNGHGRCSPGNRPVARQGNLIVDSSQRVTYAKLREMLVEELKKQGKPYGLIFDDIAGGFTFTQTFVPQAFKLLPLRVWKVHADGTADQLLRGVDLVGTPLASLERILGAGDDDDVFNGTCGAESGWVPVSAASPSLLVATIEVERQRKGQDKPPLLPAPKHDPEKESDKKGTP
ncbi:MAG TPA: metallopeptidase TldD-related protein, partial [Candidatus Eisenbacteria bacterium]|nr:metallopeptidase TldD-related protein [Candidatus Eisenbacteria bacterium]